VWRSNGQVKHWVPGRLRAHWQDASAVRVCRTSSPGSDHYCFTLPFALIETFGWFTILDVLLVAYTFFGIEEIGVEIEGPFGNDANDLPLQEICETIHHNLYSLTGMTQSARKAVPRGL
jgi:hypothetical protein